MKNIYLILICTLCLGSCYEDKGNYEYTDLSKVQVTGIESKYIVNLLSQFNVNPQVISEDKAQKFDYMWTCYDKTPSTVIPKVDTLSFEKNLSKVIEFKPSTYELVFAYRDIERNITRYIRSEMVVESKYSRGWYILKSKDGITDIDFMSPTFQNNNLISRVSGMLLQGDARGLSFIESYAFLDPAISKVVKDNKCLCVVSDKDLKILRISDLRLLGDFKSLFFQLPQVKSPQKWFATADETCLINDGKLYIVDPRTAQVGISKFHMAKVGNYKLASVFTKNGTMSPLLFDELSGKFCTSSYRNANLLFLESDGQSKNPDTYPNMNIVYAGFIDKGMWEGGLGFVVMQEKSSTQRYILHHNMANLVNWDDSFLKNRITKVEKLSLDSKVNQASIYAMNREFEMLYFSVKDKLYYYDLQNGTENELKTSSNQPLSFDSNVVLMKHIIYNNTYDAPDELINYLVVATEKAGKYKTYLYEIVANKLKDNPIIYEGEGTPSEVMYMSSTMLNNYICY